MEEFNLQKIAESIQYTLPLEWANYDIPSYEEIEDAYTKEFTNYILPKGGKHFWILDAEYPFA